MEKYNTSKICYTHEEYHIMSNITTFLPEIYGDHPSSVVSFANYDALRAQLENGLQYYNSCTYSLDTYDIAAENRDQLKQIKKVISDKKKALEEAYKAPYADAEAKLSELLAMIEVPLKAADNFIKDADKRKKEQDVLGFARKEAERLGEHGEKILASPAFFDTKWLNATCTTKKWQGEVKDILVRAADDIASIQAAGGKHTPALLAQYYESLSMTSTQNFLASLKKTEMQENTVSDTHSEGVVGYKILRITANEHQMLQLMSQMELMGLDVEEIEDGMPRAMEETTTADFDSFVAFDIEHTGTFGIANGDAEAEIIEIGAVKVVNGVITERFDELCNPSRKIVPRIAKLTNITDEMVKDKPSVDEIIRRFKEFVGDNVLVGHNIKACDIPHITRAAKRAGIAFDNAYLDTRPLAKKHQASCGWENIKLTTLSAYFGITQNEAHRAWCDAEANAQVYLKLKNL